MKCSIFFSVFHQINTKVFFVFFNSDANWAGICLKEESIGITRFTKINQESGFEKHTRGWSKQLNDGLIHYLTKCITIMSSLNYSVGGGGVSNRIWIEPTKGLKEKQRTRKQLQRIQSTCLLDSQLLVDLRPWADRQAECSESTSSDTWRDSRPCDSLMLCCSSVSADDSRKVHLRV